MGEAFTYGLSIIIIYLILGLAITVVFGAGKLNELATSAVFNLIFFGLLVVFAISFFGAFDIKLPSKWSNKIDAERIIEQDPRYESLYQCRPGVTSIATLRNGYTDTMDKMLRRLRYDLFYLRHRSWLLDMKILAQTFFSIVGAKKF